jgi:4-hydroxyphenylacetate 3-monooxygenase
MGIRTGRQVLDGLRDGRELWCDGERIADVTRDPRFAGGAQTLAELYDLQHDQEFGDEMTYASPTTDDRVGLSFIEPRSQDELVRRRVMMKRWADHTLGMFPRSPDFMNVLIAAFATGADGFGPFADNMTAYYEYVREGDLVLTHSLTNPQVDRSRDVSDQVKDVAARVVRETDAGIVVSGARMLATLGAFADEILVMPAPSFPLPETEEAKDFAMGFALPVATPGMRFIARPMLYSGSAGSPLDQPLTARFDDSDCLVIFDDVLVPWERVFIHRDVEIFNGIHRHTGAPTAMAHQYTTKDLAKIEFMMGLAFAMVRTTNVDVHQHVQGMLAELINSTETIRACLIAAEAEASETRFGTVAPAPGPLSAVRFTFPPIFRRACEIIQNLGAGGLFMVPSYAEFEGARAADAERYYQAANADARSRVRLFRLAHDAALSSFSGRQQLYERYFAADPVRAAQILYQNYDKAPHIERIGALLDDLERHRGDPVEGPPFRSLTDPTSDHNP